MSDDLTYPVKVVGDSRVDARNTSLSTTDSPGDDSSELPLSVALAHHGAATVALARVLTLLTTGTHEAWMQVEARSETCATHLMLADVVADHWYVDLLQDVLVLAEVAEGVLAPTGRPASIVING